MPTFDNADSLKMPFLLLLESCQARKAGFIKRNQRLNKIYELHYVRILDWERRVVNHFTKELARFTIPSLNLVQNHSIMDGQLVSFRCMVQVMFDPEFYLTKYQVRNTKDGSMRTLCGRYRDAMSIGPVEELVTDGAECDTRERLALY